LLPMLFETASDCVWYSVVMASSACGAISPVMNQLQNTQHSGNRTKEKDQVFLSAQVGVHAVVRLRSPLPA
jgi:hypothetical protein